MFSIVLAVLCTLLITLIVANFVTGEKKIQASIKRLYPIRDTQFLRSMGMLLGPAILQGNRIRHYENGCEIFPAMLEAIRGARKTITFETYIYWSGRIGNEFAEALCERARAGVKVHLLLDWVGSISMDQALLAKMLDAGIECVRYHKPHWYNITRMNNRTHRKLLVIDGRIGFTGGVGIADHWQGNAESPAEWRDSHFSVEGPVAAEFQAVFLDNWMKAEGRVLHGGDYFPLLSPQGEKAAQMFSSSPSSGSESMHLMYLLSITAAQRSIRLSSSYFVPEALAIRALVKAARRGVRIQIIIPGEYIDAQSVRRASRARWGRLLAAGIEIYEYKPTMYHCKMLIVDDFMVSVGSTNFDNRSFRLNDEANLNVYDEAFALEMTEVFERDLKQSERVTLKKWRARSLVEKIWERSISFLASQM
ncbi:MAG TPA: cardiolipin synthase [Gammaproteobacteria bacterium]|nr:cardiolipin synthase [Gammaproteobacteria bacterium]